MIGSLTVKEQSEEPVNLRDGRFSCEGLTADEWKGPQLQCVSSQTLCSALVQVAGDETGALVIWKKSQNMVLRSNRCKNRNDIAGQPIGIEWRVFLDTSVHELQKIKFSCWKLDTTLIVCQTGPCSRACSTKLGKPKSTNKCPAPAEEVANYAATFRLGY